MHTLSDDQVFDNTALATVPFPSFGPSNENKLVMHIPIGPGEVEKLLSADSIVPYLHGVRY